MAASSIESPDIRAKSVQREEISCPVCLEVFEEPLVLPSCGHSVCLQCLQNMTKRNPPSLLCPVCRSESVLGENGLKSLAVNIGIVKILEETKGERQREGILKAFEAAVQKMSDAEKMLVGLDTVIERRRSHRDALKSQIHELAEQMMATIMVKEQELCEQVDRQTTDHEKKYKNQKVMYKNFVENSRVLISKVEEHLSKPEEERSYEVGKALLLESRKFTNANVHKSLTAHDAVMAKYSPNNALLSRIEEEGLGKIYSTNASAFTRCSLVKECIGESENSVHPCPPLGAEITIRASDLGLESFSPLCLATDGRNSIAVADPANSNVLLLDKHGNLKKKFKPIKSDKQPVTFSGVAFTKSNELIAVCGSTEVYYLNTQDGSFKMSYKTSDKYGIRYCFITIGSDGRVVLTCEPSIRHYRPCIFVYMDIPFGKPDLKFGITGDNKLEFPFKAVYHNNEYFVSDMEKGCILVYDCRGMYRRSFGGRESASSSELMLPTGLAVCAKNRCLYVCDWGSCSIQVYRPDGAFVAMFAIEGRPTDIAIMNNGTVVVSSKDDQWIKFYSLPPFNVE